MQTAAGEMSTVARLNRRTKDPVYHYVLSWPSPERPTDAQATDAINTTLADLGLSEHQWVGAIHRNTAHVHAHVVVNRVHPETLRTASPRRDWLTLDHACRALEVKYGWTHDRGPHVVAPDGRVRRSVEVTRPASHSEPRLSAEAKDFQAWTGLESFQQWIASEPAQAVRTLLGNPRATWQDLHAALRSFNLEYRRKGSGAIVVDRDAPTKLCAKASHLGRFAAISRLEALLGPYEPAAQRLVIEGQDNDGPTATKSDRSYRNYSNRPPLERSLRSYRIDSLYQRYVDEMTAWRSVGLPAHRRAVQSQRQVEQQRQVALRQLQQIARKSIARVTSASDQRILYSYGAWLRAAIRERWRVQASMERKALRAHREALFPGSWAQWLAREAAKGDPLAMRRLRQTRLRERRQVATAFESEIGSLSSTTPTSAVAFECFRVIVQPDGLDYIAQGRVVFRDCGRRVAIYDANDHSIHAALLLAREKWGPTLTVAGTQAFIDKTAVLGMSMRMEIQPRPDDLRDSPRLLGAHAGWSESQVTALQEVARQAGKSLIYCASKPGQRFTGKMVTAVVGEGDVAVVVLDLGRRLGVFDVERAWLNDAPDPGRLVVALGTDNREGSLTARWRFRQLEPERTGPEVDF